MFDPNAPLPDFAAQTAEVARQKQMVDMLRSMGSGQPSGQMVGRHYVAPAFTQQLNPLMAQLASAFLGNKNAEAQQSLGKDIGAAKTNWMSTLPQTTPGHPEFPGPRDVGGSPELDAQRPQVPDRSSVLKATMAGMQIPGNEQSAMLWNKGMGEEVQREDNQTEKRDTQKALFRQQKELEATRLEQKAEEAKIRSEDQKLSIEQRRQAASDMAEFRRAHDGTLLAIAQMKNDKPAATKPVPDKVISTLRDAQNKADFIAESAKTFDPKFGGMGGLAKATMGTWMGGGNTDAANWWKDYAKNSQLVERHAMFGSALTASEKGAWRDADIAPGMNPKLIQENLAKRAALGAKMYERTRDQYSKAGYNVDEAFPATAAPPSAVTKTLNGKVYIQKDGKWYEQ